MSQVNIDEVVSCLGALALAIDLGEEGSKTYPAARRVNS